MSKSQHAQDMADEWVNWLSTRRFFGPPVPKHIIAVLSMPDTSGEPPDAKLSQQIAAFHLGVCSLPEDKGRPFIRVYCGVPHLPIKTLAHSEGVSRETYYERAHTGAMQALKAMRNTIEMLESMNEQCQV